MSVATFAVRVGNLLSAVEARRECTPDEAITVLVASAAVVACAQRDPSGTEGRARELWLSRCAELYDRAQAQVSAPEPLVRLVDHGNG